nr:hypothetical protein [Tanacetum cinerariifolium]
AGRSVSADKPIPAGRSISADKPIPAGRSVSTDKSIPAVRDSPFDLEAFLDSDYAGAAGDRKSTTGGCQLMGRRLISWQCKKQTIVATSSCEAEYVAADSCCELVSTIDGYEHTISEATIRTALHLDDFDATDVLPNQEIFDGLQAIGYRPDGPWSFLFKKRKFAPQWKFLIHYLNHCISPKGGFFYSVWKPIGLGMVSNVSGRHKFLMYPRFVQLALNITPTDNTEYDVAQTNPFEGPPIAPQADEPMPDPAHAPNVEELIPSLVLEPVVQPIQTPSPIGSPSHLDIPSFEITQERLSMLEIDRLKAQDEDERKKRLADLSKSDSESAKQVALTMETSHAAPAPQVPATGPLPSIERQRDLDDMIANFSNTEWMILMARVKDFPKVAKEILGTDVNDDNFSSRLQALVDKRKRAMSIQTFRAQQAKPMTRGETIKFMRTYIKNMSAAYYSSGRTMEWANKFVGDDLIAEYNKIKSS